MSATSSSASWSAWVFREAASSLVSEVNGGLHFRSIAVPVVRQDDLVQRQVLVLFGDRINLGLSVNSFRHGRVTFLNSQGPCSLRCQSRARSRERVSSISFCLLGGRISGICRQGDRACTYFAVLRVRRFRGCSDGSGPVMSQNVQAIIALSMLSAMVGGGGF